MVTGSHMMRTYIRSIDATVTPMTREEVANTILENRGRDSRLTVANLNLHGAYVLMTSQIMRTFTDKADIVLIDGWPILAATRRLNPKVTPRHRVGSTDWLDALLVDPRASGINILAVGGSFEASSEAERNVKRMHPHVNWRGRDGFDDANTIELMKRDISWADLVIVGMGMPVQENWIVNHWAELDGKTVANVGGCIDYYSGTQNLAPRWLGPLGLEWLYRLLRSPRRLAYRYLIEPWKLAYQIVRKRAYRA